MVNQPARLLLLHDGNADMNDIDPIETARELATHANDIKHLQDDMDRLISDMSEIKQSIAAIQKTLAEADGGKKILFATISAAGMVGGVIAWVVERFWVK